MMRIVNTEKRTMRIHLMRGWLPMQESLLDALTGKPANFLSGSLWKDGVTPNGSLQNGELF
jgi:hypothetical protein